MSDTPEQATSDSEHEQPTTAGREGFGCPR